MSIPAIAAQEREKRPNMANTTLSEAFANNEKPAKPQFISPATFNPCTGNVHSFLGSYERTAIANGWNNGLKMSYLTSFLGGAANIWFLIYKEKSINQTKGWAAIKTDLREEFVEGNAQRSIGLGTQHGRSE